MGQGIWSGIWSDSCCRGGLKVDHDEIGCFVSDRFDGQAVHHPNAIQAGAPFLDAAFTGGDRIDRRPKVRALEKHIVGLLQVTQASDSFHGFSLYLEFQTEVRAHVSIAFADARGQPCIALN